MRRGPVAQLLVVLAIAVVVFGVLGVVAYATLRDPAKRATRAVASPSGDDVLNRDAGYTYCPSTLSWSETMDFATAGS